jgi:hypothetical protein
MMEHVRHGLFIFTVPVSRAVYAVYFCLVLISLSECKTNYHNNFSVQNGIRTYYGGVPDLIQVGEHQFVEASLINTWVDLMLTAW